MVYLLVKPVCFGGIAVGINLLLFNLLNLSITKSSVHISCGSLCIVWKYEMNVITVLLLRVRLTTPFTMLTEARLLTHL